MSGHDHQGVGQAGTLAKRATTAADVSTAPQQAQATPTDPKFLRVLVVDSKASSRTAVCSLLRDCEYQVTAVRTSAEALQYLLTGGQQGAGQHDESAEGRQHNPNGAASHDPSRAVDLVIKEHEPPSADAGRLLRKMARSELLRKTPVVVMSSQDEREVVMNCLTLGAIDYLVKPLRHNELRHIWTRVWWWRRSGLGAPIPDMEMPPATMSRPHDLFARSYQSSESKETKCDDEEEPTSKEGSAPDGNNGSNGNGHGSNGSKDGNGTSRVEAKPHGNGNGNGNGSSDNKNGHHGSNGNGASTTLAVERNGAHPLAHTAEGRAPQGLAAQDTQTLNKVATGRSLACPGDVYNTPPASSSRKRPFSQVVEVDETPNGGNTMRAGTAHQPAAGEQPPTKVKTTANHRVERHERERGGAGDRGTSAAPGHGAANRVASGSHPSVPSHDTVQPSQRAQLIHASGGSGAHMEVVASVSGVAHGSASRTAHGTTGGSGADPTGTASVAHFAPHHVQASGVGSLTHSGHMPHWANMAHPGMPGAHMQNPSNSQSGGFPPLYPGTFGLPPHLLSQPLGVPLPMYAHPSPTVSGPQELHPGLNPMAASNAFLAMQLNQQMNAPREQVGPTLEGCSSGGLSRGGRPPNDTAGSMAGFGHHPNAFLAQAYLQAFQQINQANLGSLGSVQGHALQAQMPGAQAAMAAAWAAGGAPGLVGGMPGAGFPGQHLHPHSLLHQVGATNSGPSLSLSAMASGGPAAALQLAMQQQLLANPALSMAAAAAAVGVPHSPSSAMLAGGPPQGMPLGPGMSLAVAQAGAGAIEQSTSGRTSVPTPDPAGLMMLATMGNMMIGPGQAASLGPPGTGPTSGMTGGPMGSQPTSMQQHAQHAQHVALMTMAEQAGGPRKRRALALDKYRMKRKNLKFSSAIRYETRKVQAQSRPRIKGQFAKALGNADAPKTAHSGPCTGAASTGGAGVDEDGDDEMQGDTLPPAEDEEEEYDHGADEDENDVEEGDQQAGERGDGQQHVNLPTSLGCAQGATGSGSHPRRSSRHSGRPHARAKSRMGSLASADWSRPPGEPAGPAADGGAGAGAGNEPQVKKDPQPGDELCEDEEDVVDSLRELKEGHRSVPASKHHQYRSGTHGEDSHQHTHASKGQAQPAQPAPAAPEGASATSSESGEARKAAPPIAALPGPQTSLSMGSQSGLAASKGSLGRTSQLQRCAGSGRVGGGVNTVQAEQGAARGGDSSQQGQLGGAGTREGRGDNRDGDCIPIGQRVSSHGREQSARSGERSSHADAHGSNVANTSNGKNGSDSGSNSPDENGNGGSGSGTRHGGHGGVQGVDQAHGSGGHGSAQQQHGANHRP